jgi:hypothetical protein
MSGNGDGGHLIFKAELVDKKIKISFGKDLPNTLMIDRALRLVSLQLDDMLIEGQQNLSPYKPIAVTQLPQSLMDKIRGK